jgi:hypothetical protein
MEKKHNVVGCERRDIRVTQGKESPKWERNCIYWQDLQGKFQQVHLLLLDS